MSSFKSTRYFHVKVKHSIGIPGRIEIVGQEPLHGVINELGGWPVLDPSWSGESWRFEDMVGRLRHAYSSESIIIRASVSVDDTNSNVHILKVKQSELLTDCSCFCSIT